MNPAVGFLIYVLGVFVLGAFAAYPLALGLEAAGVELEFHSVLSRTLKILAVVGLFPLLAVLGMKGREIWGFGLARREFLCQLLVGLVIGIAMMGVLVCVLLLAGVREHNPKVDIELMGMLKLLLKALVAGLVIGLVEEVWFRGALQSVLVRALPLFVAVVALAGLYSLVHFLKGDTAMDPATPVWSSGFSMLAGIFSTLGDPADLDSALALFVAGVLLAVVRQHTGNIAACIGIHAGWVVVIKVIKDTTMLDHHSPWRWLAGNYDGVIGYLGALWLTALLIAYYWWYVRTAEHRSRSGHV